MQHLYFLHFNNCVVSLNCKMLKNLNFSLGKSELLIERQRPFFQEMNSICSRIYYYEARN